MTTDEKKKGADAALATIQRYAMGIVALPAAKREARYALIRESHMEAGRSMKIGDKKDWEDLDDNMVEWTRALVRIIESGGGSKGGTA